MALQVGVVGVGVTSGDVLELVGVGIFPFKDDILPIVSITWSSAL